MAFDPRPNSNRRPGTKFSYAQTFLECVSCGAYRVLSQLERLSDEEAIARAKAAGWSIAGVGRAKATRCRKCRREGVRHRRFADNDPRYGEASRRNPLLKPRGA